jgi:beta-galactosidase
MQIVPFSTGWLFGPATAGSTEPGFDDSGLQPVTLPHTVTPLSWRNWDPGTWQRDWVYRKHFASLPQASGMRVFLDVAGALTSCTPVLNGRALPGNTGGYRPFSVELTGALSDGDNVLALTLGSQFNVDVPPDRPAPSDPRSLDYWQPGGIYRDVKLRVVPQVFICDVFAKPVNVLDATTRQLSVEYTLAAAVVPSGSASVAVEVLDRSRVVASASAPVTISATGQVTGTVTVSGLTGITLWDTDNPKLYTVTTTLHLAGTPVHEYRVRTGFRAVSFTLDGFFLNGNRVKLIGLNRHQFFPFAGGAMPARVQRRDAHILRRELNCNIVRCSHYPQSDDFFDACDELGLMCWEEIPGWGYFGDAAWQEAGAQDLRSMITRDRNHPSVIIWGAMPNEAGEHVTEYTAYNDLAHSIDNSRPTGGDGYPAASNFVFDVFSNHDYASVTGPDGLRSPRLVAPVDAAGKPYLICEAVGALSGPALAYRRTDPQQLQQGLATAHAAILDTCYSDDRYCGLVAWAGFDYLSDATGNCFQGVKYVGVVDLFRAAKPGAAIYRSQVDPAVRPVIEPAFYWEFGARYPVTMLPSAMICSNLDRLEVYVGGSFFATVTPDTAAYPHLPYAPSFVSFSGVSGRPELRIDGYLNGALVASRRFCADTADDRLAVTADDASLVADGVDATRVEFRAVDKHGNSRPYVGGSVSLSVSGPGVLVGESPFAFGDTGGVGAVWIRTVPGSAGTVTVTASHPVLGSGTAVIEVVPGRGGLAEVPSGAVTVRASREVVTPGSTFTLTASFTLASDTVPLTPLLPPGWTATAESVTSPASVRARWRISVPADAMPQAAVLTVQYGHAVVFVPYPSLAAAFGNVGITADASPAAGNLDGGGSSYSATALALGATLTTPDGLEYTWPDVAPGQPDNALGSGQTVLVDGRPGATALGLLASCTGGGGYGTIILRYADGTSQYRQAYLNDWTSGPAASGPDQGYSVAATAAYCNAADGTKKATASYVYAVTVPVDPSRRLIAVTLPNRSATVNTVVNAAHIFALTTGTPVEYPSLAAAFNNTGISDDSAVTTEDFDGAGYSYSQQALAAAGLTPGATVSHDGLSFTWPGGPAGQPDNVLALGQTVLFSGTGSRLGILGATSPSATLGTGVVHYADGTSSEFTFTLNDYWYPPGPANEVVATLPYLNRTSGRTEHPVYVFYTSVPIIPGREVRSVTLPRNGANPPAGRCSGMHIFALAVG